MQKVRISAVKYANTFPFIWGLKESGFYRKADIETDHPAVCAAKLADGRVDIGLIPVAAIPGVRNSTIIGDFCIGADGPVRTVMLLSNCPFSDLDTINLDYRSVSSVNLVKVLALCMWKKDFRWLNTSERTDFFNFGCNEAVVLIGDQCFESENKFKYRLDLAAEWKKHTGLPFVFACWVANREIDPEFISGFNSALRLGTENIDLVVKEFSNNSVIKGEALRDYLTQNIDFILDSRKRDGMNLFLKLMKEIQS